MKHSIIDAETREDILDTIQICEGHLADVAASEGKDLGPFARVFVPDTVDFARKQIAFEKTKLRIMTMRELIAEQRADENAPAREWTDLRLESLETVLEAWERGLRAF